MVFGYNKIPYTSLEKKNSDFMDGYNQGLEERNDIGFTNSTIPVHTDDNYRSYFVGYHDGTEYMGDYAAKHDETAPYVCPSGHNKEFCKGFLTGEGDEGWEEFDA